MAAATVKIYRVEATWDDEAQVWVAMSANIPGLVTEARTYQTLLEKLRVLVPELLELNSPGDLPARAKIEVITRQLEDVRLHA
jgi:hypothetical protein